jgi:type IV pilus assembly protein PilO
MDLGLDKLQVHLDKLAKLPKGARMAVVPVLMVIVFGVYGYLFFVPARQELAKAEQERLQLQRKLSEVRAVAANEQAVRDEIAMLEKKLAVALRQLPDSKELPVLLTDVTSLGKNAGLDFRAFRPQQEIRRAFYAEVPIDIEFTGGFHDIATFFDQIARLPRIINITDLEMTIGKENSVKTLLTVEGKATTFRFVEPDPEPQVDPKAKGKGKGRRGAQNKAAAKGGAAQGGAR